MARKIIKKILDVIIYIVIATLFVYVVLAGYQRLIKKNNMFQLGDYYIFEIASGSMEYNLHIGDFIVVQKMDEYSVGDVVTYREGNYYITHRISQFDGEAIITKGDANSTVDEPIYRDDIVGKFLFRADLLTFVVKYKIYFVSAIVFGIIVSFLLKEKDGKESENDKGTT